MDLSHARQEYTQGILDEAHAPDTPDTLFGLWLQDALTQGVPEPYAFSLATCRDNVPSARILLLRKVVKAPFGIEFYTNYDSPKGQDLAVNPNAQAQFFWHRLQRQVRLSGTVTRLTNAQNDAYFAKRPYLNQIGAHISNPQSAPISDRKHLIDQEAILTARYQHRVPRPDYWGGYLLKITTAEFWQGRAGRIHDRLEYTRYRDIWQMRRLAP